MKPIKILSAFVILLFAINILFALDTVHQNRLNFGHVLIINNITTSPEELIPGNAGKLELSIYNSGAVSAKDIRIKLTLPSELAFVNDVSQKNFPEIKSGDEQVFYFNIIPLLNTEEGIYKASLIIDYLNSVGEERQDNYSIGVLVKSVPKLFATIEKADIYKEKRTGDITITLSNYDLANIKFLTIELMESKDYDILSSEKKYIGDLDSNDFQSSVFTLNVKSNQNKVLIPIKITYKDSLNKDYSEDIELSLPMRTAKELGIRNNNSLFFVIILIIAGIIGGYYYRRRLARRRAKY